MSVESAADRAQFLVDFGGPVAWMRGATSWPLTGIFERPAIMVEGLSEAAMIDRDASLLVCEADLPSGAAVDDAVTVEGQAQAYACQAIRPDGTGFAVIDLKKA